MLWCMSAESKQSRSRAGERLGESGGQDLPLVPQWPIEQISAQSRIQFDDGTQSVDHSNGQQMQSSAGLTADGVEQINKFRLFN